MTPEGNGPAQGLTQLPRRAIEQGPGEPNRAPKNQLEAKMPVRLDRSSADFDQRFGAFLAAKREASADVEAAARAIVDDVAKRGDAALLEATAKFDRLTLDAASLRVTAGEIEAAVKACDAATLDALKLARDRIETYHVRQLPKDERFTDALGVELGWRYTAIESAGLYVPGGTAAYPSSVLMNAVPAKVAGVARVVMVVPSPDGKLNLLAQAEHDASAQSILITDSVRLAADVEKAVEAQLKTLPRAAIAGRSWADFGAIIMVKNLADAIPLADAIAAEHLEIMTDDPDALAAKIRNAGAVFLGAHTPEAIGDYVGGSNHVLPTEIGRAHV